MVNVTCNGQVLQAQEGALLSDVLTAAHFTVAHPCGGHGNCKKCLVTVDGHPVLSCQYRIYKDVSVVLPQQSAIISQSSAAETGQVSENMCFALDIGTTTLALALVNLDSRAIIKTIVQNNPQHIYGADIMSRIDYCRRNGVEELFSCLRDAVNTMIASFAVAEVETLFVSGNTTMLHLFWKTDCSAIGVAPYTPAFLGRREASAAMLGLQGVRRVISLPGISSFVGADLVAGLNWVGRPESGKYQLLVDLGTNAEILLFSDQVLLCTAAAAGPCFEGANISCGMSATSGAVYSYKDGQAQTIDNAPARGICGTGIVGVIAALLQDGTIDETGYMACGEFSIAPGVVLTQADIRQFQAAKAAVCSAIITLLNHQGLQPADVETLYISGGFSAGIDPNSAAVTGLFPKILVDKCVPIHNSSLLGCSKYAWEQQDLSGLLSGAEYIDLSANPDFSQLFIENMLFEDT